MKKLKTAIAGLITALSTVFVAEWSKLLNWSAGWPNWTEDVIGVIALLLVGMALGFILAYTYLRR